MARGRARPRALEPPLFAEVVRDALEVEALAGAGAGVVPHPPGFGRPSPFAALPHAVYADPVRLARFWRHELGVGDDGPLPDLVPLLEAAGVDVVHARLDGDTPHGACALVAVPWAGVAQGTARAAAAAASATAASAPTAATAPSATTAPTAATAASVRPFVFVNGFGRPVALQRFALAHEFAHLALGTARPTTSASTGRGAAAARPTPTPSPRSSSRRCRPCGAGSRWTARRRARALSRASPPPRTPTRRLAVRPPAPSDRAAPSDPAAAVLDTVIRLANHFGVSFWVARYRARAAGIVSGPTQLRVLDQALRARQERLIPRQLFLGGLRDTLSVLTAESRPGQSKNPWRIAPQGVRVPGRMRAQVLALLEAGAVPLEQAAAWLRIGPADLRDQLGQFGVE